MADIVPSEWVGFVYFRTNHWRFQREYTPFLQQLVAPTIAGRKVDYGDHFQIIVLVPDEQINYHGQALCLDSFQLQFRQIGA